MKDAKNIWNINKMKRRDNLKTFFLQKTIYPIDLNKNAEKWIYLGIPILISLIVKLILLSALHQSTINMDGILYITAAKQYAAGNIANGLELYPMPVYPLLIALVHMLIPDWIFAGYVISILSMVLVIIPLYYLTKHMFGVRAAFWASLMLALLPKINEWSLYVSRDPLFLLIFAWCIYFTLRSFKKTGFSLFWITFVLAWSSVMIRLEGMIFIFFYFIYLIYTAFINRELRSDYLFKSLIWVGLPICVTMVAFFIMSGHCIAINRLDQVFFELINFLNGNFLDLYSQIYQFFKEAESQPPFSGLHYNLAALARHYLLILYFIGITEVLLKVIFPLSAIPLYIALKDKLTYSGKFILGLWSLHIGLTFYFLLTRDFLSTRFLIIPAFLMIPWIGSGIDKLCIKLNKPLHKKLILCLIAAFILAPTVKSFELMRFNDNATPMAVKWLVKNHMIKQQQVVTNNKKLPFYIDLEKKRGTLNSQLHYSYNSNLPFYVDMKQEQKKSDKKIHYFYNPKGSKKIENFALQNNADLLIINLPTKNKTKIPNFNSFKKVHTISGGCDLVQIYVKNTNNHGAQ